MELADLPLLNVSQLAPLLANRDVSPVEVTRAHLDTLSAVTMIRRWRVGCVRR